MFEIPNPHGQLAATLDERRRLGRTGRFETTRRLAAETDAVAVDSPETGIVYYWRVLTLTPRMSSISPRVMGWR